MLYDDASEQTTYVNTERRDSDLRTAAARAIKLPMLNWPLDLYAQFVEVND